MKEALALKFMNVHKKIKLNLSYMNVTTITNFFFSNINAR